MPRQPAVVTVFIVDLEAALWRAVVAEFLNVTTKGCTFHYSWRNVQEVGLQRDYLMKWHLYNFIWYIYTQFIRTGSVG